MGDTVAAEKRIAISMFGGFKIIIDDKLVTDSINRSNRIWNLLSYLIVNRARDIPQSELIEAIWPDEDTDSPGSSLKTLVYRVRGMLAGELGEELPLILSQRNSYSWNNEYDCALDIEEFEKYCAQGADARRSDDERMETYKRATGLYKGDFLPKLSDQLWVIPLEAHYHSLFVSAVKDYVNLLFGCDKYADAEDVCARALKIEPLDENLHTLMILSYARQGNDTAALSQYEVATDLLYRNLGVQPSDELRQVYTELMKGKKNLEMDLGVIQTSLKEAAGENGAFVCDYGFFREAYRLEARRAARSGTCVHLALLTVATPKGKTPSLTVLGDVMEYLKEAIKINLRRGDVVSRYSGAQYVLMLSTANYEDGEMVVSRIISTYYKKHPSSSIRISYKLQQLEFAF